MWQGIPSIKARRQWIWDINGRNLLRLEKIIRFGIAIINGSNVLRAHYDNGFGHEYVFPIYESEEINDVYKFITETFGNDMKYPG